MALIVLCDSLPRKIVIAGMCALACVWMQSPVALAQHGAHAGGGHPAPGGHASGGPISSPHVFPPHTAPPPTPHGPSARPPVVFGQRAAFGPPAGVFEQRPIFLRHRVFRPARFFWFAWGGYPGWWLNCGAGWAFDFGCGWRAPEYGVENYLAPPMVIYEPVYMYYGGGRELVDLFLKDGTVYSVTDYWFVGDKIHFTVLEEGGTKSAEQLIGLDELDFQKTIEVNTRRGFRLVRRDEPLDQYLRDHPDANAPLLEPPPKN